MRPQEPKQDRDLDPAGDARSRRLADEAAGGADSAPEETAPSGDKAAAAERARQAKGDEPAAPRSP